MGAFGQVTTLSMLDNQTVLTIRMISDNERNDFNAFISNSSTLISKLLVSQKKGKPKLLCSHLIIKPAFTLHMSIFFHRVL